LRDAADLCSVLIELTEDGLLQFQIGVVNGEQRRRQGQASPMRLTLAAWDRAERLKRRNPDSDLAFMAMKFGDPAMDAVLAEHFRPAIAAAGLSLERVAEGAGSIDLHIELQIAASRLVVADLSHGNRGAYFEAGFARGLGRPMIYTCSRNAWDDPATRPHFDVDHHFCLRWTNPAPTADEMERLTHPRVAGAHRMNAGVARLPGRGGTEQLVRFAFKGCSDIVGQLRTGEFLAVECKRSGEHPRPYQQAFLDRVRQAGGVAFVARSVRDVIDALGRTCRRTPRSV
jgi:hypothetical protein